MNCSSFRVLFRRYLTGLCALVVLGAGGAVWAQNTRMGDYIIAVVNERPITNQELRLYKRLKAFVTGQAQSTESDMDLLNQMVDAQVVVLEAEKLGIKISDAELDREFANMAKLNRISPQALRQRFEEAGIPWVFVEQFVRDQRTVERMRMERVLRTIKVSAAETQKTMDQALAELQTKHLRLAQILIPVPERASETLVQEAKARAEQIRQTVLDGAVFEQVAQKESKAPDAASGGDMGERETQRWPDLFVQAVAGLEVGGLSQPVRSGAGWHVLKLLGQRQASQMPTYTETMARHILIRASDPKAYAAARQKLVQLRNDIVQKKIQFEEAAEKTSEDGSASQGGNLGWAGPGSYVPEFESAMNALEPGQVSAPVETEFGVHLIEVLQRRTVEVSKEQIRQQIENRLREQKAPKAVEEWLMGLRGRAFIELRESPQ